MPVLLAVVVAISLAPGQSPAQPPAEPLRPSDAAALRGVIVDAATGAPLPGAQVQLVELGLAAQSRADGTFAFDELTPGRYSLTVSLIGYIFVRRQVDLAPGANVDLTVPVTGGAGAYQETVRVTPAADAGTEPGVGSQTELDSAALQELRGVAADDPMRAVQALPGVATGDDFQSQFSVRGSQFRHVGIVFDGTATPLMLHTVRSTDDTASIAVVNTDVLEGASLLAGAHPRRHGDWLGATLDFTLREGSRDRTAFRAAASATTASFVAEGPIGASKRGAWLASIRRSYIDWLVRKLYPSIDGTLGFTDVQSKLAYDLTDRQQLQFVILAGDAGFRNENSSLANGIHRAASRTALGSVVWRYTRDRWMTSQRMSFVGASFTDTGRFDQELGRGYGRSLIWRGDAAWFPGGAWSFEAGGKREWQHQTLTLRNFGLAGGRPRARVTVEAANDTAVSSAYGQVARRTDATAVSAGARVTHDTLSERTVVSPWLLGERTVRSITLRASAGVAHQFPELELQRGLPERVPERAAMVDAAAAGALPGRTFWQTTVFWRRERHVLRRTAEDRLLDGSRIVESVFPLFASSLDGRTRGIDLMFGRRASTGVTGWIAYTYARSRVRDRLTAEEFDGDFDQRHTLNGFVQARLSYRTALSAKLRVGSNFPLSGYFQGSTDDLSLGPDRNLVRLPAYVRLDMRANRTFTLERRRVTLFIELVNVTHRRNLGQRPGHVSGQGFQALNYTEKLLPFLPSAGVLVEF